MVAFNNVKASSDFLLHSVRSSGLNYVCQETPFSIFLTVRKTFVKSISPSPPSPTSILEPEKFNVKQEKLLEDNNSLKEAFNRLKNDYGDAIEQCESYSQVIEELNQKTEVLNKKLSDEKVVNENVENKIKQATNDRNKMESKFDEVIKENKTLKKEISELSNQIKTSSKDLKTALKDKRDISNDFEKKIRAFETENKTLVEYKILKEAEEKDLKLKLKSANKKLKSVTEKEAKLENEKLNFNKLKVSLRSETEKEVKSCQTDSDYGDKSMNTKARTISTEFYTADITTYPSMVTHWKPLNLDIIKDQKIMPITAEEVREILEKNRKDTEEHLKKYLKQ